MKRNTRSIFILILLVIISGAVSGQIKDLNAPIPPDPNIRIGRLENGLTYYIKYNKKPEQRIELRLAINAGSICENDSQLGLAHFCEHMCFNGTKNFPSNRIIDMLEEMGMKFGEEINAYTSFDQTIYMLKVPADKPESINRGFQVLEDWAHQVSLDDVEIDKERNVIIEEWRLGLGAEERMMQKYLPVLLKDSRYAERLPIGKVDILKTFPYDTLRSFYSTWYRTDLMAVVVVGDIDPQMAEDKVKEYFGRIPAAVNPKPRKEYPVPENDEPLISVVTDKEASGYNAQIMFKQPKSDQITYKDYRSSQIRYLFIGMLNNRFQELTMKPDAPFLYAGAGYGDFIGRSVDVYSLFAAAKENQLAKSIEAIMAENEKVRQFGFTSTELERQKMDVLTMYENGAKEADKVESGTYADEYIRNYLDKESIPGYQKEYELVKALLPGITLEEVNKLGKEWTGGQNIIALITAQEKEGIKVPTEDQVTEIIKSARSKNVEAYVDAVTESPLLTEVPVPSKVTKRIDNSVFGFTELVFGNGVRMILKPTDFKNDEIVMTAFSPGGISLYPDNDVMSASLASSIISQSGIGDYDFTSLQKKLSGNTAKLSPYINDLREGVNGSCTPKDLETMLQLNYLYFSKTRRDEDAYNSFLSRMKNMIKPMRSVPRVIFQDTLSKIVSMNSPRVIAIPSDTQLEMVNLDRIMYIFRDRFADASDFTYIMVGNFKTEEVIPMLEKYIGGLPSIRRTEIWKDLTPGFPEGINKVIVPENSEPQSQVAMVWKGDFKWKTDHRQGFAMLMSILEIKLRESMREDQGGVYGVSIDGGASKLPHPSYTISSQWGCKPENLEKLSQTVIDEMNKIKNGGPEETDLNKVKETMIRERETQVKENGFWISYLQNHYINGNKILLLEEYKSLVNSMTVKKIKAIANRYLDTQNYVQVYLTPKEEAVAN
ncbi:MAG TPA: insulinase family protein [Bacteroidales bacterium]|nr:insulinase family protein [Bacteroidales bacterium]